MMCIVLNEFVFIRITPQSNIAFFRFGAILLVVKVKVILYRNRVAIPFGIRRMFLWLVPHKYDLAGTLGVFALDVVLGGIIGGFALIFQILGGVIETVKG